MKLIMENWRKFLNEDDWRETYWADDNHKITIGAVDDYLRKQSIEVVPLDIQELLKQIPKLDLDPHRIAKANLEFPIIVVKSGGQYRYVLDGNHRLAQAVEKGFKTVCTRILDLDEVNIPIHWKELLGS